MSRIELHCPSCGYDVPMTLLPPPQMFECPECQEVMPRDKLTRLKVLHRHIAGAPPSPMSITTLATSFDVAGTGSAVSDSFPLLNNQLLVAVVASQGGTASAPSAVTLGGVDALTTAVEAGAGTDPVIGIYYYKGVLTTQGLNTLNVTIAGNPTDICMAMMMVNGAAASPLDKTKGNNSISTSFTSTATVALTADGEIAVGAVVGSAVTISFTGGFIPLQLVDDGVNLQLGTGRRLSSGRSAVTCTGGLGSSTVYSCVVATFKPA